jgi:hypothetical protein
MSTASDSGIKAEIEDKPGDVDLTAIPLINVWVLYVYSKSAFKKLSSNSGEDTKPYKEVCKLKTVNDLIYIVKLMGMKSDSSDISNLDKNDYIVMREGIEPIWEDPKNERGGTFSIKLNHEDGYDLWTQIMFNVFCDSFTTNPEDMKHINGISVSFIMGNNFYQNVRASKPQNYTYIKIWDGYPGRTMEEFLSKVHPDILYGINKHSVMYAENKSKRGFGDKALNKMTKAKQRPEPGTNDDRYYRGKRYY